MGNGAIARIIVWSIVALILISLLVSLLVYEGSENGHLHIPVLTIGKTYQNSEKYIIGGGTVSDKINDIEINWVSGKVNVIKYDGNTIEISEAKADSDDNKLRYLVENGKLTIQFRKPGWIFNLSRHPNKELTVKIPNDISENLNHFNINSVSAELNASDIHAKDEFNINTVSGNTQLNNITAQNTALKTVSGEMSANRLKTDKLDSKSVSGEISIDGEIKKYESDSTSGDIIINSKISIDYLECKSVSGSIKIFIPEENGFTMDYHSTSGNFSSEFPITSKSGSKVYGNGIGNFSVKTVSGDIDINKIK